VVMALSLLGAGSERVCPVERYAAKAGAILLHSKRENRGARWEVRLCRLASRGKKSNRRTAFPQKRDPGVLRSLSLTEVRLLNPVGRAQRAEDRKLWRVPRALHRYTIIEVYGC
jgi:hypothetical protein